jgi:hypothetical protein
MQIRIHINMRGISMALSRYFKGHGEEVMANMKKEYGSKKGTSVFYATVNKKKKSQSNSYPEKYDHHINGS